jgi:hypothetical protein
MEVARLAGINPMSQPHREHLVKLRYFRSLLWESNLQREVAHVAITKNLRGGKTNAESCLRERSQTHPSGS